MSKFNTGTLHAYTSNVDIEVHVDPSQNWVYQRQEGYKYVYTNGFVTIKVNEKLDKELKVLE